MRQRIVEMRVDALLRDEHVRTVAREQRRDDRVECADVRRAVRVRRQRDIDAEPRALPAPAFLGETGPRKERPPGLVQRDREHLVRLVEGGLHTITVVRVDVDVGDPHPAVGEQTAHDRRVVVDAEARCATPHRMMESTRAVERDTQPARRDLFHRAKRPAGRE